MMKKIKLIIILIVVFFLGFYFANTDFFIEDNTDNSEIDKVDLSEMTDLWKKIEEKFVDTREDQSEKITNQEHLWGAMQGLTASYGDPYTTFLTPKDTKHLKDEISGEFSGIGAEIVNRNGFLMVVSPLPGTPAYRAGLKPKDIISKIDHKDSLEMSASRAVRLIRGERGTIIKLEILRKGNADPIELNIKRDIIEIPIVKTFNKNGVFVIKIYSFTENLPKKFVEAIKEFIKSKNKKLIIDVRGNPGGHLFAVTYILGLFLEKEKIILTEDHGSLIKDKEDNKVLRSGDYHSNESLINIFNNNLQLGVLMDEGSASASEILAGVLSDHKKAILYGKNTFGKGTVQELISLKNDTALKVTVAKWILPSGSWISHKGIFPDVQIDISEEELADLLNSGLLETKIDPQLDRAIKHLSKYKTIEQYRKDLDKFFKERRLKKDEIKEKLKEKIQEELNIEK